MTPEEIHTRGEALAAAYNAQSASDLLALYSNDVVFSDFGVSMLNMDKEALAGFFVGLMDACEDMKITTRGPRVGIMEPES